MLSTPEVSRLTDLIRDSFRIRQNHNPAYVDVADHLQRFRAKQHQVVYGRRGSGKSCLFVHFLNDENANRGVLPLYIECDELKRLTYPDLLIRVLLSIFEKLPDATKKWRRLIRRPNDVQKSIQQLRDLLRQAESSQVVETASQSRNQGFSAERAGFAGERAKSQHREIQTEFAQRKLDQLERFLVDFKRTLTESIESSKHESAFLLVDDFYLLSRRYQPDVVDYLHRLVRGTECYLKIATIRHRTTIIRNDEQTIGLELSEDAEEINLDRTLEDVDATSDYLARMLEQLAHTAGLDDVRDTLFNPDAFHALVLASGGVPRDFLNILVESVSVALVDGHDRWLTPTNIWKGANRVSYRTKLNNLGEEGIADTSPLELVYRDIVQFCLQEKKKTGFLVSLEGAREKPAINELILQLMDFKLIHIIEPDTSAASGRLGRYAAYTLDFSLFMEPRLRNIEHIEFWKVDDHRRRVGVREAPDYDLSRAERAIGGEPIPEIEETLQHASQ